MIIASFVVKNESPRWWHSVLAHTAQFADEIFVYDDRSDDDTADIALSYTRHVVVRPEGSTSFSEHEGKFRLNALEALTNTFSPTRDDWILSLDADEFFVGRGTDEATTLDRMQKFCGDEKNSMNVPVLEIWNVNGPYPLRRKDGFWADQAAPRFFRWQEDAVFLNKQIGCGSVPTYALKGVSKSVTLSSILHFGYILDQDKQKKHAFYKSAAGRGHNPRHVDSILQSPVLAEYHGRTPKFWVGRK